MRDAEKAIGKVTYNIGSKATNLSKLASRSLFITKDVKKGETLTEDNVRSIRPGNGLHPKYYYEILGKKINFDLEKGTPLELKHIIDMF